MGEEHEIGVLRRSGWSGKVVNLGGLALQCAMPSFLREVWRWVMSMELWLCDYNFIGWGDWWEFVSFLGRDLFLCCLYSFSFMAVLQSSYSVRPARQPIVIVRSL